MGRMAGCGAPHLEHLRTIVTDTAAPPALRFEAVTRRFGALVALDRLSLDSFAGEFFALLGPSGCGKSTLLRLAAGFDAPSEGRILLHGKPLTAPPHLRPVNMMFQSYALFPHMSVADNVAFGLKQEGLPKTEIEKRVAEMLALVQLSALGARRPHQLSGGQRQRVALARALAKRPQVLLLDEPLAALDKKLRAETQFELKRLQRRLGTTFVIVTHDQEEAMTVADRMAVMEGGRIAQVGTPDEIYEHPVSRAVADFIGDVNLLQGRVTQVEASGLRVACDRLGEVVAGAAPDVKAGDSVWLALRPEKIAIMRQSDAAAGANAIGGTVSELGYRGEQSMLEVRTASGMTMKALIHNRRRQAADAPLVGEAVWLGFAPDDAVVLTR
jgi:putrescine transport system ATP-binding protein